jgi:AraC-like DNA-binding protein
MSGNGAVETSPIDQAFERLHLDGAIFFRAEMTEPWAYQSPPAEIAELLRPGSKRLIMFHVVACGRLWVRVDEGEPHWACAGDLIVLPYGDQHWVGGVEPAEVVPIITLLDPPPWDYLPVLHHGSGGQRTDIVCGYLHSEDPLFSPDLHALPPVFVVRPEGPAAQWVQASVDYALAASATPPVHEMHNTRLPELLLIEALRLHLASAPTADRGWLAALRDPILAPALAQLHADPRRKWTVADLAATTAVSRSVLDERFRQVLGRSPIRYLADWRMHLAEDLLAATEQGVAAIAHEVGYESEEGFSRAFKRRHGASPSAWRERRRTMPARRSG